MDANYEAQLDTGTTRDAIHDSCSMPSNGPSRSDSETVGQWDTSDLPTSGENLTLAPGAFRPLNDLGFPLLEQFLMQAPEIAGIRNDLGFPLPEQFLVQLA